MIKQVIDIDGYWKVIVYYNVDYDFFDIIYKDLKQAGCGNNNIKLLYKNMSSRKAKAVTYNNIKTQISVVCFNKHKTTADYISSIVHEAKHITDDIMLYYKIHNYGEPPAYTIGYIVKCMYNVFNSIVDNK